MNAGYCVQANQKTVTARRRQMRRRVGQRVGPTRAGELGLRGGELYRNAQKRNLAPVYGPDPVYLGAGNVQTAAIPTVRVDDLDVEIRLRRIG